MNPTSLVVIVDDGHAARVVCRHELDDLIHGRAGEDGKRIAVHGIAHLVLRLDGMLPVSAARFSLAVASTVTPSKPAA